MSKLKDWWNRPITNGSIVKSYAKSLAAYAIVGIAANAWLNKKINEMEKVDDTVINVDFSSAEDKEG